MNGNETFMLDGQSVGFDFADFWRWQYGDPMLQQSQIAEFLVMRALNIHEPLYKSQKLKILQTSHYDPRTGENTASRQHVFKGIKTDSWRQNDLYIFCLNTGTDEASSDPLKLEHWAFYVVAADFMEAFCGGNQSVSMSKIQNLGVLPKRFDELAAYVDLVIEDAKTRKYPKYPRYPLHRL